MSVEANDSAVSNRYTEQVRTRSFKGRGGGGGPGGHSYISNGYNVKPKICGLRGEILEDPHSLRLGNVFRS